MKKYYAVTIERIVIVHASNEREAKKLAIEGERENSDCKPDAMRVKVVTTLDEIPNSWHSGAPFENEEFEDLTPMKYRLPWAAGVARKPSEQSGARSHTGEHSKTPKGDT